MATNETTQALTLQMLDWINARPRDYVEVMEAWRTSCPRLSIWEDACIEGLVACDPGSRRVSLTLKGIALLSGSVGAAPARKHVRKEREVEMRSAAQ